MKRLQNKIMNNTNTTFQLCTRIRRYLLSDCARLLNYPATEVGEVRESLSELPNYIKSTSSPINRVDPTDLTLEEMGILDFGRLNDNDTYRLIPGWLLPFLADEFVAQVFDGPPMITKSKDIDPDTRFGVLAWGVMPKLPSKEGV